MSDVWKAVAGFPGYFVSDLGKVMSVRDRHCGTTAAARLLSHDASDSGHRRVTLTNDAYRLRKVWVHRLVMITFRGLPPPRQPYVDHRDRDPGNNALDNLRWSSLLENNRNVDRRGVHFDASKGRWCARIRIGGGKRIRLGMYATEGEATRAYDAAKALHYGEFACEQ